MSDAVTDTHALIWCNISINAGKEAEVNLENEPALVRKHRLRLH